jgi:hypothetical protein
MGTLALIKPVKLTLVALVGALFLIGGCTQKSDAPGTPASLDELNRALQVVVMKCGRFPPPPEEITNFLTLQGRSFPVPPAGKKLSLNPQTRQYRWE